jgi:hypothetical protein
MPGRVRLMAQKTFAELRQLRNEIAHGRLSANAFRDRLAELGVSVPEQDAPALMRTLLSVFASFGSYQIPPPVLQVVSKLLKDHSGAVICDPWAGLGELLSVACEILEPGKAYALTPNPDEAALGRLLLSRAEWKVGPPLRAFESLGSLFDVVVSLLPFNAKSGTPLTLNGKDGSPVTLHDNLDGLILAAAASKLTAKGIGAFRRWAVLFLFWAIGAAFISCAWAWNRGRPITASRFLRALREHFDISHHCPKARIPANVRGRACQRRTYERAAHRQSKA